MTAATTVPRRSLSLPPGELSPVLPATKRFGTNSPISVNPRFAGGQSRTISPRRDPNPRRARLGSCRLIDETECLRGHHRQGLSVAVDRFLRLSGPERALMRSIQESNGQLQLGPLRPVRGIFCTPAWSWWRAQCDFSAGPGLRDSPRRFGPLHPARFAAGP